MRIARDGSWHYNGSLIGRPAMVKLFSTILRKDPGGFVLVTPVERVGIRVDDAPFLAVDMAREPGDPAESLVFRTNLDEIVVSGPDHPIRFEVAPDGGLKPYVHVRGDLWALATRSLTHDLVALARVEQADSVEIPHRTSSILMSNFFDSTWNFASPTMWKGEILGLWSGAAFFPIAAADESEAGT